jgi:hypothetical protein
MSERFELRVEVEFCKNETDDNDLAGRNVFRLRTPVDAGGTASNGSIGLGSDRAIIGETGASLDGPFLVLILLSDDEVDEDLDALEEDGVGDLSLKGCCSIPKDSEPEADGSSRSALNLTLPLETTEGAVMILLESNGSPSFILPLRGLGCSSPRTRPARLLRLEAWSWSSTSSSSPSSITGDPGGRKPSCSPERVEGGGPKPSGFEYVPLGLL